MDNVSNMKHHWQMVGKSVSNNTPMELWASACDYFKWCDDNPIVVKKLIQSGKSAGQYRHEEHIRPYSVKGLCLHCGVSEEYLISLRGMEQTNDYYTVANKVMYIIYTQAYEMAQLGIFNPIFTMKVLNMDKDETGDVAVMVNVVRSEMPKLLTSELEVINSIEAEIEKANSENEKSEETKI